MNFDQNEQIWANVWNLDNFSASGPSVPFPPKIEDRYICKDKPDPPSLSKKGKALLLWLEVALPCGNLVFRIIVLD